jgi:nitrogen fixation/metabolism regulation signal transduction histidine kinase
MATEAVVSRDTPAPLRRVVLAVLAVLGTTLWLLAVYLMLQSVQNASRFANLLPWVLLINIAGLLVLLVLIVRRVLLLVRARRQQVTGSRLEARMVWMIGMLAVLPILVVFYFSVQFISRGIDSWFGAEIGAGLNNALNLSRIALDLRSREYLGRVEQAATKLSLPLSTWQGVSDQTLVQQLNALRGETGAAELAVLGGDGRVLSLSSNSLLGSSEVPVSREMLLQTAQGQSYLSLDPVSTGNYQVRIAVPLTASADRLILSASFTLERRLAELADVVDNASRQYAELTRARQPLKTGFILSLTLVLAVTVLSAIYAAFRVARHLVKPIEDLVAGTRAVARGDFDTRLPLPANDEIGVLVHSFNDMTQRLSQARVDTARSQQAVEAERTNLAVILARLSSGVISLAPDFTMQVVNTAAANLLHIDPNDYLNQPFAVSTAQSLYGQFVAACHTRLDQGDTEWHEQFILRTDTQHCVLICACTALPGIDLNATVGKISGYVLVFDDVTTLLQAQRDAAWGEVARRLAHEIKNPLTPIRLSAERLRHKLLPGMNVADAELLDRATHTIVQQVDAMKDMVNAFSQYARTPHMNVHAFVLNELVTEVVELYRARAPELKLQLVLDAQLHTVEADRDRIRQVLHNLITNAVEAQETRSDGKIELRTRCIVHAAGNWAGISIIDAGPGFAPEVLGHMFDPYVTTKPRGTGLGLSIVKKIIDEHAGRIEATNRSEGGAIITIELPIKSAVLASMTNNELSVRDGKREQL